MNSLRFGTQIIVQAPTNVKVMVPRNGHRPTLPMAEGMGQRLIMALKKNGIEPGSYRSLYTMDIDGDTTTCYLSTPVTPTSAKTERMAELNALMAVFDSFAGLKSSTGTELEQSKDAIPAEAEAFSMDAAKEKVNRLREGLRRDENYPAEIRLDVRI